MSAHISRRGAASVGFIADLEGVEAASVIYFRLWSACRHGRAQVQSDFVETLGPRAGERAFQSFDQICTLCSSYARRPLMHHSVKCSCLGADEACFANFIATAAEGGREDTMLIATLLVRADVVPLIASCAFDFAIALKRMRLGAPRIYAAVPSQPSTLH
jgi:hypothetical protein